MPNNSRASSSFNSSSEPFLDASSFSSEKNMSKASDSLYSEVSASS
jgi:hypothetical protein